MSAGAWVPKNEAKIIEEVKLQDISEQTNGQRCESVHLDALESLFGLPRNQVEKWPGIIAYCKYLETCFQTICLEEYRSVWKSSNLPTPCTGASCWPWFNSICIALLKLQQDDYSIKDIWGNVRSASSVSETLKSEDEYNTNGEIAVFAALCWATMTLHPLLLSSERKGQQSLAIRYHGRNCPGLNLSFAERPIPTTFRDIQRTLPGGRWHQPLGSSNRNDYDNSESSVTLYVSTLNYATLQAISKIRLEWVDNISNHLDFDPTSRKLYVFRFPSFCALNTLRANHSPILEGMSEEDFHDFGESPKISTRISQEILMSFRLLFGQTSSSRKKCEIALEELKEQDNLFDQLLETVCKSSYKDADVKSLPSFWPSSCLTVDGRNLQEADSYSSQDDFPIFGQRLAKLQAFTLRQQPTKLLDLWRDRRNPLQFYTFWAVLVIGGLGILLAFLQLVVAVWQLALAQAAANPSSEKAV